MRVSSVCSADCGLRCGAVQCGAVGEQQPLIEDAPNKIFWLLAGRKRQGHSGAAEPIAVEIQGSTDP